MTTLTDSGQGMDVAIGGLGFRLANSKERPYERATAQFRKEQLDSAPTVGDQSLTGMWTRGQLSFHKGAGVEYYEVLEGEGVLNRYLDSDSVDVSEPGKVTLFPALSDMSIAALDAVPAPLSTGGGIYALTGTGVKYTAGSGTTSIATSDAVVPTSITSSGSLYYVANGTKIERQFVASEARTNHVTNPSFEVDTAGWLADLGSIGRTSAWTKYGTHSLEVTPGGFGGAAKTVLTGLTIGQVYAFKAYVRIRTGGSGYYGIALLADSTVVASTGAAPPADTEYALAGTFTATATSHNIFIKSGSDGGGAGPNHPTFYTDAVLFTESPYTSDYFDGTQPGCAWAGTAHASKSTFATSSSGASTVRITLTGATWKKVWWAKGRIWAVDSNGYWYALADTVQTVSNTAAFWNSGKTGVNWSLAQGTGPVYISDGYDVYTVTVGTDGAVPVLTTPTTAARVPLGEEIADLSYYLGYLVMPTTRGVRVALTDASSVLLGPLVIEGDFSKSNRVGLYDTKAYVVGRPDGRGGNNVLCVLDLGQLISDLTPAWSPLSTISTISSSYSGALMDASGKLYAWASASLLGASRDVLSATGYVTTGYHRFGTLEQKAFRTVLVRIGGTGGTVTVYRVDPDGSATSLQVLTTSTEVSLGMSATGERIGLKFLLTRATTDTTKGPELLGYQLKALPAPSRQRLIRVPLLLMDDERRGGTPATGYAGSAYDRLAALESMEASGGVHDFQDFRTGETGTVFIESIEHTGHTPPGVNSSGFGGILMVTLRKI